MRVAAEILKRLGWAAERRLGVNDPIAVSARRQILGEGLGLAQMNQGSGELELALPAAPVFFGNTSEPSMVRPRSMSSSHPRYAVRRRGCDLHRRLRRPQFHGKGSTINLSWGNPLRQDWILECLRLSATRQALFDE